MNVPFLYYLPISDDLPLGIPYNQVRVTPHSEVAQQYHTFGFLPTLVIHEIDGKRVDLRLRESSAVVRYIDRVKPEPSLHLRATDVDASGNPILEEKMWEFVSLAGPHGTRDLPSHSSGSDFVILTFRRLPDRRRRSGEAKGCGD